METQVIKKCLKRAKSELAEARNKVDELEQDVRVLEHGFIQSLKDLPKVERAVILIKELGLPTYLFNCISTDLHDAYYQYDDGLAISPVCTYEYTDVTGLSEEEFKQVVEQLQQ